MNTEKPVTVIGQPSLRFELLSLLGRGGAGTVWHARMHRAYGLQMEVALKITEPGNGALARRARDEARILGLLRHRAIVSILDVVHLEDGRWALVMELVDGVPLNQVVQLGPVPLSVSLEMLAEVADALSFAFSHEDSEGRPLRMCHRDIKLGNLMLTADGRVKVLDFGIAHVATELRESTTQVGEVWGTFGYMSPERLQGMSGEAADVYALGVVLYELCSRRRLGRTSPERHAHEDRVESALDAMAALAVPRSLLNLCGRLLSYDAEQRPSREELRDELRAIREEISGPSLASWAGPAVAAVRKRLAPATLPPEHEELRAGPTAAPVEAQVDTTIHPGPTRGPRAVAALLAVALLALGLLVYDRTHGAPVAVASAAAADATTPPATAQAEDEPSAPEAEVEAVAEVAPPEPSSEQPARTDRPKRDPPTATRGTGTTKAEPPPTGDMPVGEARPAAETPPASKKSTETVEELGFVKIRGPARSLFLRAEDGTQRQPGPVPSGVWSLMSGAESPPRSLGQIHVQPGQVLWITCEEDLSSCAAR